MSIYNWKQSARDVNCTSNLNFSNGLRAGYSSGNSAYQDDFIYIQKWQQDNIEISGTDDSVWGTCSLRIKRYDNILCLNIYNWTVIPTGAGLAGFRSADGVIPEGFYGEASMVLGQVWLKNSSSGAFYCFQISITDSGRFRGDLMNTSAVVIDQSIVGPNSEGYFSVVAWQNSIAENVE